MKRGARPLDRFVIDIDDHFTAALLAGITTDLLAERVEHTVAWNAKGQHHINTAHQAAQLINTTTDVVIFLVKDKGREAFRYHLSNDVFGDDFDGAA